MAVNIEERVKQLRFFTKKAENCWFVQMDKKSYFESFYVTITRPGGTIVMTGDYFSLVVSPYCKDADEVINWMAHADSIDYFAEKVRLANQEHQTTAYSEEMAKRVLAEHIASVFDIHDELSDFFLEVMKTGVRNKDGLKEDLYRRLMVVEDLDTPTLERILDGSMKALMVVIDNDLSTVLGWREVREQLESECNFHDLWELNPDDFTFQIRWQHQCLLWWAKNIIDKRDVPQFEVEQCAVQTAQTK